MDKWILKKIMFIQLFIIPDQRNGSLEVDSVVEFQLFFLITNNWHTYYFMEVLELSKFYL